MFEKRKNILINDYRDTKDNIANDINIHVNKAKRTVRKEIRGFPFKLVAYFFVAIVIISYFSNSSRLDSHDSELNTMKEDIDVISSKDFVYNDTIYDFDFVTEDELDSELENLGGGSSSDTYVTNIVFGNNDDNLADNTTDQLQNGTWSRIFTHTNRTTLDSLAGGLFYNDNWINNTFYNKTTSDGKYIAAETDPVFSASPAFAMAVGDKVNWDDAYSWGDHAGVGYITLNHWHNDSYFLKTILQPWMANWNASYSWGNHSTQGYFSNESEINLDYLMFDDPLNNFEKDDLNNVLYNITRMQNSFWSPGWISGGTLLSNGNTTIHVSSGSGYAFRSGILTRVEWSEDSSFDGFISHVVYYIYVNDTGVISKSTSSINDTKILLGAAYNFSGLTYVWNTPVRGKNVDFWQSSFMERAIGPLVQQGCSVTVNGTLMPTIQSGSVYTSLNNYTISEKTIFYRGYTIDNNVTWVVESINNSVCVDYYDSPAGLAPLGDKWKKDMLAIDFINDICYLGYGQITYDNESEAINGVCPSFPEIFNSVTVFICTFTVNSSVTSLDGHVQDVRPYLPRLFGTVPSIITEIMAGIRWGEILDIPAGFLDGVDDVGQSDLSGNNTDQLSEGSTNFWATLARIRSLLSGQWINLNNLSLGTKSISSTNITAWDSLHPYYADNTSLNLTGSVFSINNSIWGENLAWDGRFVNATGGGGGGGSYDQDLNTTDDVTFASVTAKNVNISDATLATKWNMYVDVNGTLVWEMIP